MTDVQIKKINKKYPNSEIWTKGRIVRKDLSKIILVIRVNGIINEIEDPKVLEKLIKLLGKKEVYKK
jgi:hypothetical protein